MSPALANFVFESANFLLLSAALGWVLFRPVRAALDREKAQHDQQMEDLNKLRAEAESLKSSAQAAREAVAQQTSQQRAEILAQAKQDAERLLSEAKQAQAAERMRFVGELKIRREADTAALIDNLGRVAGESVRRLLLALRGPALDSALVRSACERLRQIPDAARQKAVVESSHPLDAESKSLLQEVLGTEYEERIRGDLGAGVRVTTPAGQIDASALAFSREAAQALHAALMEESDEPGGRHG